MEKTRTIVSDDRFINANILEKPLETKQTRGAEQSSAKPKIQHVLKCQFFYKVYYYRKLTLHEINSNFKNSR